MEQDERAQLRTVAAYFVAAGDQPVGPVSRGGPRLGVGRHFGQYPAPGKVGRGGRTTCAEDHGVDTCGEVPSCHAAVVRHAHREPRARPLGGEPQLFTSQADFTRQIEHSQRTRAHGGSGEPCRRDTERMHREDEVPH
ncbi:hypothetical protein [Streptomyces palmae]|uniref:hypothetical protein n=1 Tax=Streptomyces palmae TaxID=1701085 RepID=UPI001FD7AA0E|nr:hypothetical protein [Streptomyces palmae]